MRLPGVLNRAPRFLASDAWPRATVVPGFGAIVPGFGDADAPFSVTSWGPGREQVL